MKVLILTMDLGLDGEKIIRLTEGTQRQIDCHVTEAHPAPDIQWEGPLEPEPHRRQLDRVKKYVKKYEESRMEEESFSGNITIIDKVREIINTVCIIEYILGASRITANLYCEFVHLYWERCVICSMYLQ